MKVKAYKGCNYHLFDKAGTIDRYTLINKDGDMYGFSGEPFHPQGIGQYVGDWTGGSKAHLGKRITINDLPENAQQFVKERI
jgi:hypothetical protein